MIARVWRGWVSTRRAGEYADIVERTGMNGYRKTPGNRGAQLLTRDLGDGRTELVTLSWWTALDDIRAFAGDDIGTARYYPEDDDYLVDRETTVAHFDVASPQIEPAVAGEREVFDPATGFTITRVIPGDTETLFAHFVEPAAFSRWFVVDGYTTPEADLELVPRPGGNIEGVMVPDDGGQPVPFTATYVSVDAPHTVQLAFTDPTELVTISLLGLGRAGTQLTYRNEGAPLVGRAEALAGAERMIDLLEASVTSPVDAAGHDLAGSAPRPGVPATVNTDFAFLAGEWDTVQRRLTAPLTGSDEWYEFPATVSCQLLFGGNGVFDVLRSPERDLEGMALRLYDPQERLWRIWWASNNTGGTLDVPVVGAFADGVGTFECDDTYQDKPVRVRYQWSRMHTAEPRWEQALSADGGHTWEVNWVATFTRRP